MDAQTTVTTQRAQMSSKRGVLWFLAVCLCALLLSAWKFKATGQPPFLHRENVWSVAMYTGPSPFALKPVTPDNTPILTAANVTDMDALFVADPFMVQDGGAWYLFVEVLNRSTNQGDIAVAKSNDQGASWQYLQTVLDEEWHLSYPSVFRWHDTWYLVPQGDTGVHLYEAESFPFDWRRVATLIQGDACADPTVFRYDDSWWMFLGRSGTHDQLQLFYADQLKGPWIEHPQSPLVSQDPDRARPGGKVIQYDGSLYRFAQDCAPKYGNQLRAFRVTNLNRNEYSELPIEGEFVLQAGGDGWNANGMHHLDAHQLHDGTWRAVVDGHKKTWTLGWTP